MSIPVMLQPVRAFLISGSLALAVGACSDRFSLEGVSCIVDTDCASGQQCVGTQCVGDATGDCRVDTDCPTGQRCDNAACVGSSSPSSPGDGTPPRVERYYPSVGNLQIYPDTLISVTFSEQVDPDTVSADTIQLLSRRSYDGDPSTLNQPIDLMFEITDNTVTLVPERGPLPEYVTDLTLELSGGIQDITGESLFPTRTLAFRTLFAEPSAPYRIHLLGLDQVLGVTEGADNVWRLDLYPADADSPDTLWSIAWFGGENYLIQSLAPGQLGRIEGGDGSAPATVVRGASVFTGQQFVFTEGPARASAGVGQSQFSYRMSTLFQGEERPLGWQNDENADGVFIRDAKGTNEFWWFERTDMTRRDACDGDRDCVPWACETSTRSCFTVCIGDEQCSGASCVDGYCE
jgi:hypothetical protein